MKRKRRREPRLACLEIAGSKFFLTVDQFKKVMFDVAYYDDLNSDHPDFFEEDWVQVVEGIHQSLSDK